MVRGTVQYRQSLSTTALHLLRREFCTLVPYIVIAVGPKMLIDSILSWTDSFNNYIIILGQRGRVHN